MKSLIKRAEELNGYGLRRVWENHYKVFFDDYQDAKEFFKFLMDKSMEAHLRYSSEAAAEEVYFVYNGE